MVDMAVAADMVDMPVAADMVDTAATAAMAAIMEVAIIFMAAASAARPCTEATIACAGPGTVGDACVRAFFDQVEVVMAGLGPAHPRLGRR